MHRGTNLRGWYAYSSPAGSHNQAGHNAQSRPAHLCNSTYRTNPIDNIVDTIGFGVAIACDQVERQRRILAHLTRL